MNPTIGQDWPPAPLVAPVMFLDSNLYFMHYNIFAWEILNFHSRNVKDIQNYKINVLTFLASYYQLPNHVIDGIIHNKINSFYQKWIVLKNKIVFSK